MSRSYKHTYYCGDSKGKQKKRIANKSVRQWLKDHPDELLCGKQFRKVYCSYNVCDYFWTYQSYEEFLQGEKKWWLNRHHTLEDFDEEDCYKFWIKHYVSK